MNYRQKAAVANSEISEEISAKLLELERKKSRIEYYVGMLDNRKANVIRLCFFEGQTIEDTADGKIYRVNPENIQFTDNY